MFCLKTWALETWALETWALETWALESGLQNEVKLRLKLACLIGRRTETVDSDLGASYSDCI